MTTSSPRRSARRRAAALAAGLMLACTLALQTMHTANAAPLFPRPDGAVELQGTADGGTIMRIKVNSVPSGAKNLEVFARNVKTGRFENIGFCPAARTTASGSDGCTFKAAAGGSVQELRAYWFNSAGQKGASWDFWGGDLGVLYPRKGDKLIEGTITQIWIGATRSDITRVYKAADAAVRKHAAGCATDSGVKAGLSAIDRASRNAASETRNPYVIGASVVASVVNKQDSKTYDNRCEAIAEMLKDAAAAAANAVRTGQSSRLYLTSAYGKWKGVPDSCVIATSSGGWGGDDSDLTYKITRPASAGGPNERACLHFWDPLVS